jgi:AcrR family transcriptional regulator
MKLKAKSTAFPKPVNIPSSPRREPKGQRGAAVIEKVTKAGIALLSAKSSRDVTVVDIAKNALVARASLLLQFPDGMQDILATIANREYGEIGAAEMVLWEQNPPMTPVESVCRLLDAVLERAKATGRLYSNLMAEALQTAGGHRDEIGGTFGLIGISVVLRAVAELPPDEYFIDARSMALGEMLIRSAWSIAASGWAIKPEMLSMRYATASPTDITYTLAEALVPVIRSICWKPAASKMKTRELARNRT